MSTTQPEALRLADEYAEASFDQGLHKRTLDDAPENARSALEAELRRLNQSEREGWRHADELEQERKRLHAENADLRAQLEAAPLMGAAGDAGWVSLPGTAYAELPDALEALQLKSCPCGATPTALQITGDEQAKWAHVSGNCCGEWEIEYRNNYAKLASTEAMTLAAAAWNEAPRASRGQAPAGAGESAYDPCGGCGEDDPKKRCLGCMHPFTPAAQPAQADSVLEDAARYRWLRDSNIINDVINDEMYVHVDSSAYPGRWALTGAELDEAIDTARKHETAALAAKKGGE